jgi:hypothetical protein
MRNNDLDIDPMPSPYIMKLVPAGVGLLVIAAIYYYAAPWLAAVAGPLAEIGAK